MRYLFREVFKKRVSEEYLTKKYDTSWTGLKHVAWLAYQSGQPVAMYGALPQRFRQGNDTFLGVHTCDSFTLETHQRKGLHQELALRAYECMRGEGVPFVYAYHSEATYHSCKKLNWKEGPVMQGFWLPTNRLGYARIRNRLFPERIPAGLLKLRHDSEFMNSYHGGLHFHVDYANDLLAYKSFSSNLVIRLGSAIFWVKSGAVLMVGDARAENEEDMLNGVKALQDFAGQNGFAKILFQLHPEAALKLALKEIPGVVPFDSWPVGYLPLGGDVDWKNWRGNYADLDTF